jgi:hypothetical protein
VLLLSNAKEMVKKSLGCARLLYICPYQALLLKHMKKTLLTIALAGAMHGAFSQKLLKPEVDKISGDTTWRTDEQALYAKLTLVGANEIVCLQPKKAGQTYYAWLNITQPKTSQYYYILEGKKLFFKFADKTVITLSAAKDNLEEKVGSNTVTFGSVGEGLKTYTPFLLSTEDLEKFSTTPLEFVRIESSKGNLDYDVKPKLADKVQKSFALIKSK